MPLPIWFLSIDTDVYWLWPTHPQGPKQVAHLFEPLRLLYTRYYQHMVNEVKVRHNFHLPSSCA